MRRRCLTGFAPILIPIVLALTWHRSNRALPPLLIGAGPVVVGTRCWTPDIGKD